MNHQQQRRKRNSGKTWFAVFCALGVGVGLLWYWPISVAFMAFAALFSWPLLALFFGFILDIAYGAPPHTLVLFALPAIETVCALLLLRYGARRYLFSASKEETPYF